MQWKHAHCLFCLSSWRSHQLNYLSLPWPLSLPLNCCRFVSLSVLSNFHSVHRICQLGLAFTFVLSSFCTMNSNLLQNSIGRVFYLKKICFAIFFSDFQQADCQTDCYHYCQGETILSQQSLLSLSTGTCGHLLM